MNAAVALVFSLAITMTSWGELPRVRPTEHNRLHHWPDWIAEHELARRWPDLPAWIRDTDRYHERMPLWILRFVDQRGVVFEDVDRFWSTTELPFDRPSDLVLHLILYDPVIFGETQLTVYQSGLPWRYDAFQAAWLRYPGQETILQSAFETGKTETFIHRALFYAMTRRGEQLLGAAEASHVKTMYKYVGRYLAANAWLGSHVASDRGGDPYPEITMHNGNVLSFRWAGTDGTSFRSVHAGVAVYLDEAVKAKGAGAEEAFGNLLTRTLPGAELHLAAVPDGDRTCPFFQHCDAATPVDPFEPALVEDGWALFRWSKDYQRAPFGGPERRRTMASRLGGEESAKFQQNWHGHWGDAAAENIFGWNLLLPRLRAVPAYRVVRFSTIGSGANATVDGSVAELDPAFNPGLAVDSRDPDSERVIATYQGRMREFRRADRVDRIRHWIHILEPWLAPTLAALDGARLVGGIDAGELSDPTVLVLASVTPAAEGGGTVVTWRTRLQLDAMRAREQADALYAVEYLAQVDLGYGIDATGAPPLLRYLDGTVVVDGATVRLDDSRFVLSTKTPLLDAKGEPLRDHRERPITATLKHQSVELMESDLSRGAVVLPWDRAVLREMPRYQRERSRGKVRYTEHGDDTVVAGQVLRLRLDEVARRPVKTVDPLASWQPGVLAAAAARRGGLS